MKIGRFRPGLELNALALMASSMIAAFVGLVFWAVAARLPPAEVGRASAVITTATTLSALASQNVGLLVSRFIPTAGRRSRSLVLGCYGLSVGMSLLLGTGFVLFFRNDAVLATTLERLAFPVIVVVLSLFALQDWVLIGLRASRWVPVEQLAFSLLKLGLLLYLLVVMPRDSIVVSWVLPAALAVAAVSSVLLFRAVPRYAAAATTSGALPGKRDLGVAFLAEYATGAMTVIVPMVLPLIVVVNLGAEANAYYTLPWLLGEAFLMLLWNISSSYMVEASYAGAQIRVLLRRAIRLSALIIVPGVPILYLAGPWLLGFLGRGYSEQGSAVLRWVLLAVPFTMYTTLYVSTARVRNQMGRVVLLQLVALVLVVGGAQLLVQPLGIAGVGVAYLGASVFLSIVVTVLLVVQRVRGRRLPATPEADLAGVGPERS